MRGDYDERSVCVCVGRMVVANFGGWVVCGWDDVVVIGLGVEFRLDG